MKKSVVIIALAILLVVPMASAGFFDFLTGKVSGDTNVSAYVESNSVPQIISVEAPTTVTPNLGGIKTVSINFTAFDYDGALDINTGSATLNVTTTCGATGNHSGETITRVGSCPTNIPSGNNVRFECSVGLLYYDCPTTSYTVNAYVADFSGNSTLNNTVTFAYSPQLGVNIYPGSINFGSITFDDTGVHALQNTTVNLTGNDAPAGLAVKAFGLLGETDDTKQLYAENFSASTTRYWTSQNLESCSGGTTPLVNNSAQSVNQLSIIPRNDSYDGTQAVHISYCIPTVPGEGVITRQNYTTNASGPWIISAA